jgi:hypothetical protein
MQAIDGSLEPNLRRPKTPSLHSSTSNARTAAPTPIGTSGLLARRRRGATGLTRGPRDGGSFKNLASIDRLRRYQSPEGSHGLQERELSAQPEWARVPPSAHRRRAAPGGCWLITDPSSATMGFERSAGIAELDQSREHARLIRIVDAARQAAIERSTSSAPQCAAPT